MVFMQTLGPFQGVFMGKGRQEEVPGAGQGANWGLHEAGVGQNSEGQAWTPKNEPLGAATQGIKSGSKRNRIARDPEGVRFGFP